MNETQKKYLLFSLLGLGILVVGFFVNQMFQSKGTGFSNKTQTNETSDEKNTFGSSNFEFPNAPAPDEEEDQVERLWPKATAPVDPNLKEKVRKEWQDFASKHPNNLYIPTQYKNSRTEAEEKQIQENMEVYTFMDSKFAIDQATSKYASPNSAVPKFRSEKDVNPNDMKKYFDYKANEIQSRMEILQYTIENSKLSSQDLQTANTDLEGLKKELKNIKEARSQVPNT